MHVLVYLKIWFHPVLENFLHGLGFSAFYFNLSKYFPAFNDFSNIWDCNIKKILYLNACNFKPNLISVIAILCLFIVVILIGKFTMLKFSPDSHKIFWNHINNFYWIFAFTLYFAAFDTPMAIFIPISIFLGLLTIVLWYTSIKNIFTLSYA